MPGRAHRLCQPRRGTGSGRHPLPVYQHYGANIGAGRHPGHDHAWRPGIGAALRHQPAVLAFTGLNAASGGQRGMTLILTNHSGTICHVYGYPGLAFFDGLPMAAHLTWVKESHATVVLHPSGNAQALLTWRANTATGPAPFNPNISIPTSCTSPRPMSTPTCWQSGRAARSGAATSPPGRCAPRRGLGP